MVVALLLGYRGNAVEVVECAVDAHEGRVAADDLGDLAGHDVLPVLDEDGLAQHLRRLARGEDALEALEILAARSRDNSRTPMQWTDERYCGFSDTKPWIPVSDNFEKINVKKQKQDRDSILEFYKKLIMLRKEKEVIARGNIEFMEVENAGVLAYTRCLDKQKLLVCCNFRDVESQMEFTQEWKSGRKILGNYEENHKNNYKVLTLRPYEIIVLEKGEE